MILYWYVHSFWITYHAVLGNVTSFTEFAHKELKVKNIWPSRQYPQAVGKAIVKSPGGHDLLAEHLSVNRTNIDESVIEIPKNSAIILTNLTVNPSRLVDVENITSYEENYNNETDSLNLEQKNASSLQVLEHLSVAGITGITLSCIFVAGVLSVVSFVIYRNRGFNHPQVLSDHCSNLDSSGYIDDTSIRDNSEEMYSLDNDSFLNSLEAMTIQNYWTDTVKHTKL